MVRDVKRVDPRIKRVDPRRPFIVTADGRKRIVLGEIGSASTARFAPVADAHVRQKPRRTQGAAQHNVMVFVHSDHGGLAEPARQAIAAAALLADADTDVVLVVFGELHDDPAELGADRAIILPVFDALHFEPVEELAVLNELIDAFAPIHILAPDQPWSEGDLGRRLAVQRALSVATHVIELNPQGVAVYREGRRTYGRRALPELILLAPDAVDACLPFIGRGEREERGEYQRAIAAGSVYRDLGLEDVDFSQVALEEAEIIVSAGNGVHDVDTFKALADTLGAAIGASRVAVDDGRFTRGQQIGASGKTVNAKLYIAIGISGAIQHLQGIKDCRHVIAVNLDASAPIVKRADLSVIDEAQSTMAALLTEIEHAKHKARELCHGQASV